MCSAVAGEPGSSEFIPVPKLQWTESISALASVAPISLP